VIISDQLKAQITDFGISRILDVDGFTTITRSPRNVRFTAPELMLLDEGNPEAPMPAVRPTPKSDIFGLGILLLQLFHATPDSNIQRGLPYNHVRSTAVFDLGLMLRVRSGDRPQRKRYNHMEDQHWEIICRCWAGNPDDRPSITEVQEAL